MTKPCNMIQGWHHRRHIRRCILTPWRNASVFMQWRHTNSPQFTMVILSVGFPDLVPHFWKKINEKIVQFWFCVKCQFKGCFKRKCICLQKIRYFWKQKQHHQIGIKALKCLRHKHKTRFHLVQWDFSSTLEPTR